MQKLKKKTGYFRYIKENELDKACFLHGMANGDFKDLSTRATFGKVLHNKVSEIASNPKCDGFSRGLTLKSKPLIKRLEILVLILKEGSLRIKK